jgi:cell division transport system permease protein
MRRKLITLRRILKIGFLNLFRNSWLTIAATAVMIVALLIVLLAVVLNITAKNAIDELARNLKASVYLKEGVDEKQIGPLRSELSANRYVSAVNYISTSQAREDLASDFKDNKEILQAYALVGGDVLPSSLEVSVSDLSKMSEIETIAQKAEYKELISDVSLGQTDAKKTIDRAASAQRFITIGSIIAASALSLVSIMIIFNTIRMAIYTRREEIRIMKLIGATPRYIRGPFLVEASLYGVIAGIIANASVYSIVLSIGRKVSDQPEFSATYSYFTEVPTIIVMGLSAILVGILIGVVSSSLAMEKHLKLKHW